MRRERPRRWRRPLLLAAVLAGGAMAAVVGPAAGTAHAATTSTGTFTSPDPTTPSTKASPPVTGQAKVTGCITSIDLAVTPVDGQPDGSWRASIKGNGRSTQDFAWPDATRPTFTSNGRYEASAHVSYIASGPLGCTGGSATAASLPADAFAIAVPPAQPANVRVVASTTRREVSVTWDRNTEPDLVGYAVYRAPAPATCAASATSDARSAATPTNSYTDAYAEGEPGGAQCYWVQAVRKGAAPGSAVSSADSVPAKVTVPGPASGAAAGSAPLGAGGASSDPVVSAPPLPPQAATDSGQFAALLGQAKRPAPSAAAAPDGGYNQTLPFQVPPAGDEAAVVPDSAAVGSTEIRESGAGSGVGGLAAVAGALVTLVVLGHLLLLRREVTRALALEPVDPDAHLVT